MKRLVKTENGHKMCDKGWECKWSKYCCNETISDFFQVYQLENLFSKHNSPIAHAAEFFSKRNSSIAHAIKFWDYQSFITASTIYQPQGFGTTDGHLMQMKEVTAFLGHVGCKTSYLKEIASLLETGAYAREVRRILRARDLLLLACANIYD